MRDAQHDVDLTDEPWPAAIIRELPVGLLEVDGGGRVVRANPELLRLLASAGPVGVSSDRPGMVAGRPASECWPRLTEAMVAVLAGCTVDTLLRTAHADLRICAVPRRLDSRPQGGLIVVSVVAADPAPVVDLREGRPVGMTARQVV